MKPEAIFEITKSIVLIVFAVAIIMTGIRWFEHLGRKDQLINEQMIVLKENVASQRIEFSQKLLEKKLEEIDKSILELVKARDQKVTDVGEVVASSEGDNAKEVDSDMYEDGDKSYDQTIIYAKDTEDKEYPVAHVWYSPFIDGDEKWSTNNVPLDYHTNIVLAESDNRSDAYAEVYITTDYLPSTKGVKFPIALASIDWVKAPLKDKRWMFNTRLSLSMSIGDSVYPSLNLSTFSYGRTKVDMDWRFLGVGVGGDKDNVFFQFTPVEWNIGTRLPIVDNLFIGPYICIDDDSDKGFGAAISIPF